MKKITTLLALLLFATLQVAFAQKTITGKVISGENGQGIPGASVAVKGTVTGITTNENGNFVLNVPNDTTIVVSYMGFKTVEIPVGNQNRFDITLQTDVNVLGDVVVRGNRNLVIPPERAVISALGIVRDKNTITTSIQSISKDVLVRSGEQNFMNALNGRVAGVDVFSQGRNTMIATIRGIKSWTKGAQAPLFIVDGVPIVNRTVGGGMYVDISDILATINIEDIESITVLKGANAAILYGSEGVNGVVIITMKK